MDNKTWYRIAIEDKLKSTCELFPKLEQALIYVCKLFIAKEGAAKLEEIVHSVAVDTTGHGYDFKSPVPPDDPK